MGIDELRKMTEAGEISVSVKAPCTCTETEHPGWSIDECWEQPYATKVPYERTEGDGLIVCGWCDGDLWVWRHAPNVVPDLLGQIDRLRDQPRLPDLDSCPCGLGVAADPGAHGPGCPEGAAA